MPWWTCFNCMNLRGTDDILTLDFSHHLLHDVPPDVFQFERTLEELHLNSNRIADLPRQLFYCQELKVLNLQDNEIAAIPPAISSLTNLQKINLSKNSLTTLVDNIKSCKHLIHLDLSLNSLIKLPDTITSLIAMQELYLNDTFLEYLPANFGRLVNLRILELRDNNLSTLPKSMARLTQLTRIDIGHNEFTELPEVIGQLTNLTELWMDNNRIRRISSNVGNLRKLVHFEASNNLLTHLPNEVSNWVKLQELSISVNDFKDLPFSIGMMKCLVTIKADENNLQELPESICQLENLEELMISHNDLFRLPPSIGLLRKLRFLTADENLLRQLPNELCSCISLTILSVRGNKLTDIPPDIGRLVNLRVVNIVNNFITYLPVSVLNLNQLSALWISDNQSQPLMPLQKEYGPEQSVHLTCFMLPQTNSTKLVVDADDDEDDVVVENGSISRKSHAPIDQSTLAAAAAAAAAKRRICFASDPVVSIEQTGRLMRSPTPYPKELRVLAKYARYIQKTGNEDGILPTDDYAQVDDIQHTKNPEQSAIEIKEARVMNPMAHHSSNGGYGNDDDIEHEPLLVHHQPQGYIQPASLNTGIHLLRQPLTDQQHNMTTTPLLEHGHDEIDSKASYFYATVDKKAISAGQPLLDYENVSMCSSTATSNNQFAAPPSVTSESVRIHGLYGSVEYNPAKENGVAGIRMSQASSYGEESLLNSTFGVEQNRNYYPIVNGQQQSIQYFTNAPNEIHHYQQQLYHHPNIQQQQQHLHYQTMQQNGFGHLDVEPATSYNNYHHQQSINPATIDTQSLYSLEHQQQSHPIWPNRIPATGLVPTESIYGTKVESPLQPTMKQPPPYHIAKAFTKKSPTDLLIYDNYRNNGSGSGNSGNELGAGSDDSSPTDSSTTVQSNENQNHQQYRYANDAVINTVTEQNNYINHQDQQPTEPHYNNSTVLDTNLNSTQHSLNSERKGVDENRDIYENGENVDDDDDDDDDDDIDEKDLTDAQSIKSNTLSKSSSTSRNGKSQWLFGLHKNPTVHQLAIPKTNPDVGFKIVEHPKQGIYISDVGVNSMAHGLLQRSDKVLDVDGVDFSRITIKEALTVLSNAGPIINIMISRT